MSRADAFEKFWLELTTRPQEPPSEKVEPRFRFVELEEPEPRPGRRRKKPRGHRPRNWKPPSARHAEQSTVVARAAEAGHFREVYGEMVDAAALPPHEGEPRGSAAWLRLAEQVERLVGERPAKPLKLAVEACLAARRQFFGEEAMWGDLSRSAREAAWKAGLR